MVRTSLLLLTLVVCGATPATSQFVRVQVVDVGQGDGMLIRTPNQRWVLIDSGPDRTLADSLGPQFGVNRLVLLIVSHRHSDHYAAVERLLRTIPVDHFVGNLADCPNRTTDDAIRAALNDRHVPAQSLGADTMDVDGVRFIVLPPDPVDDRCPEDENDNSVVVRIEFGAFSMLFPGDADTQERDWLVAHEPALLDVSVLKAAHHGANNGTSATWLAAVTPQAVVISAGVVERYKHPMPEAVDAYKAATGGRVFCTNRHGTVRVYGYADGHFTVSRQRITSKSCVYDGTAY